MLYAFSLVVSCLLVERIVRDPDVSWEGLLREMLKPNGVGVSNLIIQKSSLLSDVLVISPLDIFVFFSSFSMMVTLACLKSCPADFKCYLVLWTGI